MEERVVLGKEKFEVPALAIAVVKDGEVVFSGGYGNAKEGAVDQNTTFAIASLSKAFTAAAMGMLVDEGSLDWDDKVVEHLPWFQMYDPYVTENMTIEDLLSHRSGLITFDGDLLWYGSDFSREEIVKRIRFRQPTYGFRDEFGYQNIMFITAGEVIEEVSGTSWDEFIKERILDPLQMERTFSHFEDFSNDQNMALPTLDGEVIPMLSYDNSGATASLNSCVADMAKWIQFWLGNGIVNGDTLLQPATINHIFSLQTPLPVGGFDKRNETHFKGYGQGWFLMDYQGDKVIHHGGGLPGYISKLALVPEQGLGVIVLSNSMSSLPTAMMYETINWAKGEKADFIETFHGFSESYEERKAEVRAARDATKKSGKPEKLPDSAYEGTYSDIMYGEVSIERNSKGTHLTFNRSAEIFSGPLAPWDDHTFKWEHKDPFLTYGLIKFEVEDEKVKGFTIDLPNDDFHFDKLHFVKQ